MYKQGFFWLLAILLSLSVGLGAARTQAQNSPQASVDRTSVDEGDSLILSIRIEGNSNDEPDLSALKKDFDIFGQGQSTQTALAQGRITTTTEWQITLAPKRGGQLIIPPLAVGAAKTQAIAIQVNPANQSAANDGSEPVFIETKIDRDSVYVQQQLLFTVRVFVAVQLDNLQLTEPEFDNATVKLLAKTAFRRNINGTPYAVHERTYAILPQQAGELTIPELIFSGVEVTRSRSLFDFPGQGRVVRRMSKQMQVHVKPIPKSFSGSVWLPARNLTLAESWDGDPHHLAVGESITRHITLRADGVIAAQLPALEALALDKAKIYADQPTLDDQQDAGGTHAKRVENMALIPAAAGPLQLPETRIVWWDIDSDSEKVATLSAEMLSISPGAGANAAAAPSQAGSPALAPPTPNTSIEARAAPAQTKIWQLACAALLALWLSTLYLYWRARRATQPRRPIAAPVNGSTPDENTAWQQLIGACRANDPAAARRALLEWARLFFKRPDLRSVDELLAIGSDGALTRELRQLDNRLFGSLPDSGDWNGETLLQVVKDLKKQFAAAGTTATQLPPLYPAS